MTPEIGTSPRPARPGRYPSLKWLGGGMAGALILLSASKALPFECSSSSAIAKCVPADRWAEKAKGGAGKFWPRILTAPDENGRCAKDEVAACCEGAPRGNIMMTCIAVVKKK
jgi:hypothetical protein